MYTAVATRLAWSNSVGVCVWHGFWIPPMKPTGMHWNRFCVIREGNYKIWFEVRKSREENDLKVEGSADVNWAGNVNNCRSTTTGLDWFSMWVEILFRGEASFKLHCCRLPKQSLLLCVRKHNKQCWSSSRAWFADLGFEHIAATEIFEDNRGCIAMSKNPFHLKHTKHIVVRFHFIREEYCKSRGQNELSGTKRSIFSEPCLHKNRVRKWS